MAANIDSRAMSPGLPYFTASMAPDLQGINMRQTPQLMDYTILKIRGNITFGTTLDRVLQDNAFFDDTHSPENLGTAGTGSQANLDTAGLLGVEVIHTTELRDLGISTLFNNSDPFEEADPFETDPAAIISQHPLTLVVPTSLVQVCSSPSSIDGVIEPFVIRSIVDRSSIEMPYISRSVKGSMSIDNVRRESVILTDVHDLRDSGAVPFLDSVGAFGVGTTDDVDQPGEFSDADQRLAPYTDTNDMELFYTSGTLDAGMRDNMILGFVSASLPYSASLPTNVRPSAVYSRRGFDFSQNDNYGYDPIAFGGLLK